MFSNKTDLAYTGSMTKYSKLSLIRLVNSIPNEDPGQCPCISMGPSFRYFDLKIGLRQIIRTLPAGMHAPEPYGDHNSDPFTSSFCLSRSYGTVSALNTHIICRLKKPIFGLP